MTDRLAEIFPPFGVRVSCGPLELTGIGPDEVVELLEVASNGVHDPAVMPFTVPWTEADAADLPFNFFQWWARTAASWTREAWSLNLGVRWNGQMVGVQSVSTQDFLVLRFGETGSWLGRRFHGQGIGTVMRQAMCALLFDHLDFEFVTSAAFTDNPASLRVSEKVGYKENGLDWNLRRGEGSRTKRLLLIREDLVRGPEIEVQGVAELRYFIGLDQGDKQSDATRV